MADTDNELEPGVWRKHAAQWERVGPPLRPGPEDGERMSRVVEAVVARHPVPDALVLGVTPEMARLPWPRNTNLLAVDHAQEMIDRVWPGFPNPGEGAKRADWLAMGLPPASRDIVVGDGIFAVMASQRYAGFLDSVRGVLRPGGVWGFRVFVAPEQRETPDQVYADGLAGRADTFHGFKMRLLMAVQRDTPSNVVTGDVWAHFDQHGPARADLAAATGWPVEQIDTIDAYRGQPTVYCFPTLSELRVLFAARGWQELSCETGTYDLAERCPTLVFRPS